MEDQGSRPMVLVQSTFKPAEDFLTVAGRHFATGDNPLLGKREYNEGHDIVWTSLADWAGRPENINRLSDIFIEFAMPPTLWLQQMLPVERTDKLIFRYRRVIYERNVANLGVQKTIAPVTAARVETGEKHGKLIAQGFSFDYYSFQQNGADRIFNGFMSQVYSNFYVSVAVGTITEFRITPSAYTHPRDRYPTNAMPRTPQDVFRQRRAHFGIINKRPLAIEFLAAEVNEMFERKDQLIEGVIMTTSDYMFLNSADAGRIYTLISGRDAMFNRSRLRDNFGLAIHQIPRLSESNHNAADEPLLRSIVARGSIGTFFDDTYSMDPEDFRSAFLDFWMVSWTSNGRDRYRLRDFFRSCFQFTPIDEVPGYYSPDNARVYTETSSDRSGPVVWDIAKCDEMNLPYPGSPNRRLLHNFCSKYDDVMRAINTRPDGNHEEYDVMVRYEPSLVEHKSSELRQMRHVLGTHITETQELQKTQGLMPVTFGGEINECKVSARRAIHLYRTARARIFAGLTADERTTFKRGLQWAEEVNSLAVGLSNDQISEIVNAAAPEGNRLPVNKFGGLDVPDGHMFTDELPAGYGNISGMYTLAKHISQFPVQARGMHKQTAELLPRFVAVYEKVISNLQKHFARCLALDPRMCPLQHSGKNVTPEMRAKIVAWYTLFRPFSPALVIPGYLKYAKDEGIFDISNLLTPVPVNSSRGDFAAKHDLGTVDEVYRMLSDVTRLSVRAIKTSERAKLLSELQKIVPVDGYFNGVSYDSVLSIAGIVARSYQNSVEDAVKEVFDKTTKSSSLANAFTALIIPLTSSSATYDNPTSPYKLAPAPPAPAAAAAPVPPPLTTLFRSSVITVNKNGDKVNNGDQRKNEEFIIALREGFKHLVVGPKSRNGTPDFSPLSGDGVTFATPFINQTWPLVPRTAKVHAKLHAESSDFAKQVEMSIGTRLTSNSAPFCNGYDPQLPAEFVDHLQYAELYSAVAFSEDYYSAVRKTFAIPDKATPGTEMPDLLVSLITHPVTGNPFSPSKDAKLSTFERRWIETHLYDCELAVAARAMLLCEMSVPALTQLYDGDIDPWLSGSILRPFETQHFHSFIFNAFGRLGTTYIGNENSFMSFQTAAKQYDFDGELTHGTVITAQEKFFWQEDARGGSDLGGKGNDFICNHPNLAIPYNIANPESEKWAMDLRKFNGRGEDLGNWSNVAVLQGKEATAEFRGVWDLDITGSWNSYGFVNELHDYHEFGRTRDDIMFDGAPFVNFIHRFYRMNTENNNANVPVEYLSFEQKARTKRFNTHCNMSSTLHTTRHRLSLTLEGTHAWGREDVNCRTIQTSRATVGF